MHFFVHSYSSRRIIKSSITAFHSVAREVSIREVCSPEGMEGRNAETVPLAHVIFVVRRPHRGGTEMWQSALYLCQHPLLSATSAFGGWAAYVSFPAFRQTFLLPSSRRIWSGWAFLVVRTVVVIVVTPCMWLITSQRKVSSQPKSNLKRETALPSETNRPVTRLHGITAKKSVIHSLHKDSQTKISQEFQSFCVLHFQLIAVLNTWYCEAHTTTTFPAATVWCQMFRVTDPDSCRQGGQCSNYYLRHFVTTQCKS